MLPQCLALVLCRAVRPEEGGRRLSVIGAFHSFFLERIPSVVESFLVWTQIMDCNGSVELELSLERVPRDSPDVEQIVVARRRIPAGDPRAIHDYRLQVPTFILAHVGDDRISLIANGTVLAHRYFVVVLRR